MVFEFLKKIVVVYKPAPDLYKESVSTAKVSNQDLLAKGDFKKEEFVKQFLTKKLPEGFVQKNNTFENIKYKTQQLTALAKKKKSARRTKRKTLSSEERKKLKVYDINEKEQRYELFLPLHELWKDYMNDLINFNKLTNKKTVELEQKLLKADFHGSIIEVTKTKCPSLLHQKGIMFQETKNTWKIIREDHEIKTIPKVSTEVSMEINGYKFTIHSKNFQFRTADRASRKFKGFLNTDL